MDGTDVPDPKLTSTSTSLFTRLQKLDNRLREHFLYFAALLLIINFAGCIFVIHAVSYTEIDWETYMIQVSKFLDHGERDYRNITGPTGPLVYPAAHVYVYSLLYSVTSNGKNILLAQYIFAAIHTIALGLVLRLYHDTRRLPLILTPVLFMSRRLLSIFVLRLFNDAVQTIPLYSALLLFIRNRWVQGCVLYSLAIGVKMNALLYAPGLAVVLCQAIGFLPALLLAFSICLPILAILGAPFLTHAPAAYLSRAFELTRKFLYKWSVNGAYLPIDVFAHPALSIALLVAHATTLLVLGHLRWTSRSSHGLFGLVRPSNWTMRPSRRLRPTHVLFVLLSSNFIGIVFARTMHYQFYTWYAHSLPFLLWRGSLPLGLKLTIIVTIELVFNVYPPHPVAAFALTISHIIIVYSLFSEPRATDETIYANEEHIHVKEQ